MSGYDRQFCRYISPWIRSSRVQTWPGSMDFSERKNPEYDFLRKGIKAVGPVSYIYGKEKNLKPILEPLSKICRTFHAHCRNDANDLRC